MSDAFDPQVAESIRKGGVVSVLVLGDAARAVPLAEALLEGGVKAMELTLRTPAALDALKAIRDNVPGMLAGVGTILTPDQVAQVVDAGGAFGVAPGLNPRVVEAAQKLGLPFAPGVVTPSEVEQAIEMGCRIMKFFPAEPIGGLPYLESLAAPSAHLGVQFIPLGGVNTGNMRSYLESRFVLGLGGTWIAKGNVIEAGDWAAISAKAREAIAVVEDVRGE